jgi:hypothetical protein
MKYRVRPSGNSMWTVSCSENGVSVVVREIIINTKIRTIHEGITTYQGFMEFETEKPLVIDNGSLTID